MEQLYAPWRLRYIIGEREEGCIFCKKPGESGRERENLILHVGERAFVIMNRYPYNAGHVMVVPRRHTCDFASLTPEESAEMAVLLQRSVSSLEGLFHAEGFNIGLNLGRSGGAGIHDHLHWHVVPRWIGDTNFMPVLADTRSVPQALEETWDLLSPAFRDTGTSRSLPEESRTAPPADTEKP